MQAGWSVEEIGRALTEPGRALPSLDFVPEATCCPSRDEPLGACKTRQRTNITLERGSFEAREHLRRCDRSRPTRTPSCPTVGSEELARLAPPGQSFGYDLIVYAGLARYLDNKQRSEIQADLRRRGIELSTGTISNLCDRFLTRLETLHLLRAPYLRAAMSSGWSLHLDATCDAGKGGCSCAWTDSGAGC